MRLDVKHLGISRAGADRLHDVSFFAQKGELIGLVGPNGAGKSTLLAALAGLLPTGGKIYYQDIPVEDLQGHEKAQTLAYIPQEREINWAVRADRIVSLGAEALRPPWSSLNEGDHINIAAAMRKMRLQKFACSSAKALSGGEKARLLTARALVQNASVLLADEPTAGLDPAHQFILMTELAELAQSNRLVIVSLHDLPMAARWCHRLIVLDQGRIVADGIPAAVLTPDLLQQVYRIKARIMKTGHGIAIETTGLVEEDKNNRL